MGYNLGNDEGKSLAQLDREERYNEPWPENPPALDGADANEVAAREVARGVIMRGLREAQKLAHKNSADAGWWKNPRTGEDLLSNPDYAPYVIATKLALLHSEASEGLEGCRVDAMDDKLPHRTMLEVELVDVLARSFDLAEKLGLDLAGAFIEKCGFNTTRPDHSLEARLKPGGKKF